MQHPDYPEEYQKKCVKFFGRDFFVDRNVLIPRLETESLVRHARKICKNRDFDRVIDLGSGSGIIGVSLFDITQKMTFVDISPNALAIAQKNFSLNFPDSSANFVVSDLLEGVDFFSDEKIFLAANLPYIKNGDWKNMSADTIFEPKIALFGGEKTGFELYEKLFWEIYNKKINATVVIEF